MTKEYLLVGQYANKTEQYADKLPSATPENESQKT